MQSTLLTLFPQYMNPVMYSVPQAIQVGYEYADP